MRESTFERWKKKKWELDKEAADVSQWCYSDFASSFSAGVSSTWEKEMLMITMHFFKEIVSVIIIFPTFILIENHWCASVSFVSHPCD